MPDWTRRLQTARTTPRVRTTVNNTRCIGAGLEFSRFTVGILNERHTAVVHRACERVDGVHVVDWTEISAADYEAVGYNEDILWAAGGIEGCLGRDHDCSEGACDGTSDIGDVWLHRV